MRSSRTCPTTPSETTAGFDRTETRPSDRLSWTEWTVGLALLVGSLPGPWLTLAFPAALAFALHDRRLVVRAVAVTVAAGTAAFALGAPLGAILLLAAILAMAGTAVAAARSAGRLDLGETALAALGGAFFGLAVGSMAAPEAVAGWEIMLDRTVRASGEAAVEQYRTFGVDASTLRTLEAMIGAVAQWLVRLWPALVAMPLWLGAWLAHRLLGRWGRIAPSLARRLVRRPFEGFRIAELVVWVLIAALAGLWIPVDAARRAAANALFVTGALYALQGAAVATWWLNRKRVGAGIRFLLAAVLLLFLPPVLLAGLLVIGLAEHWLNLRDRLPRGRSLE